MKFQKIKKVLRKLDVTVGLREQTGLYKKGMLAAIAKPIQSKYGLFRKKTNSAVIELNNGFVDAELISFFDYCILQKFFFKNEKGRDLLVKQALYAIVLRWKEKRFLKHDALWLQGEFLPYLDSCELNDLNRIGVGGICFEKERYSNPDCDGEKNKESKAAIGNGRRT